MTDREFLDGIWQKAAVLEEEKKRAMQKRPILRRRMFAGIAAAAAVFVVCVAVGTRQPAMEIPAGYEAMEAAAPRAAMLMAETDDEIFANADLILLAKTAKIGSSVYTAGNQSILTPVTFLPEKTYKGEWLAEELVVEVAGGVDHQKRLYMEYEAVFYPEEEALLFLTMDETGRVKLCSGGKYTLAEGDYLSPGGIRLTDSELCEKVKRALEPSA